MSRRTLKSWCLAIANRRGLRWAAGAATAPRSAEPLAPVGGPSSAPDRPCAPPPPGAASSPTTGAASRLERDGAEIIEAYVSAPACEELLAEVRAYAAAHALPLIIREHGDRPLRYRVIDGDAIQASLPAVIRLHDRVRRLVQQRDPRLEPLADQTARVNVNLTPPGGAYRWHYDRNAVTAILYLNAVEGGELEMYPRFRLRLARWKDSRVQRALDRLLRRWARFATTVVVAPAPGRLLLMRGDRCLHSVRRVARGDRASVIMAFDLPGSRFHAAEALAPYLYSRAASPGFDPNYRR